MIFGEARVCARHGLGGKLGFKVSKKNRESGVSRAPYFLMFVVIFFLLPSFSS